MKNNYYRALIVDDEPIARRMMRFAFEREGVMCEFASDGDEAISKNSNTHFDIVVTDLKMPNANGHKLVLELLKANDRPIVAVHTSVTDVRLTKDLLSRGVDDIVYKPTDYRNFVAKMRNMLDRRKSSNNQTSSTAVTAQDDSCLPSQSESFSASEMPTDPEFALERILKTLPLSPFATQVHRLVHDDDAEDSEIAKLVRLDPSLSSLVFRRDQENRQEVRTTSSAVSSIAVSGAGHRIIGELARAGCATGTLLRTGPWGNDIDSACRRSIAASIAARSIFRNERGDANSGIELAASMHLLGRLGLMISLPQGLEKTRTLLGQCPELSFPEVEKSVYGKSSTELLCSVLKSWNLPNEILTPLSLAESTYSILASKNAPLRNIGELLKTSIVVGLFACGDWEPGDVVDLPNDEVLSRHRVTLSDETISSIRQQMDCLNLAVPSSPQNAPTVNAAYVVLSEDKFDLFGGLLPYLGVNQMNGGASGGITIVNALSVADPSTSFKPDRSRTLIICERRHRKKWIDQGLVVSLPVTVNELRGAIHEKVNNQQ